MDISGSGGCNDPLAFLVFQTPEPHQCDNRTETDPRSSGFDQRQPCRRRWRQCSSLVGLKQSYRIPLLVPRMVFPVSAVLGELLRGPCPKVASRGAAPLSLLAESCRSATMGRV